MSETLPQIIQCEAELLMQGNDPNRRYEVRCDRKGCPKDEIIESVPALPDNISKTSSRSRVEGMMGLAAIELTEACPILRQHLHQGVPDSEVYNSGLPDCFRNAYFNNQSQNA